MTQDPKKEQELPEIGQQEQPGEPQVRRVEQKESGQESAKASPQEKSDQKELREKIEAVDLDDAQAAQVQSHANDAASLADEEKIAYLLEVAKKKGVLVAVNAAKKMNNPHVLDALHDRLADKGYYQEFVK